MEQPAPPSAELGKNRRQRRRVLGGVSAVALAGASIFGAVGIGHSEGSQQAEAIATHAGAPAAKAEQAPKPEIKLSPAAVSFIVAAELHAIQQYTWETTALMLNLAYNGGLDRLATLETGQNWTMRGQRFSGAMGVENAAYAEHRDPDMPLDQADASPAVQKIVTYRIAMDVAPNGTFRANKWPNTAAAAGLP